MPVYEFAGFRLDRDKRLLLQRDGAAVTLTPKGYDTLAYLVEHSGAVLEKERIMRAIWPDTAVEENNLTQNISLLRRVLGEGRGEHRFIATVPGRGYQFVAPVNVVGRADVDRGSRAHEFCLKGRFHLFQMTESGIQTGIRYFEQAIEENPRYAPAYVGLAHAYRMFGLSLERPASEAGSKSKTAALQAVAIDETLAEAHAVLAFTLYWYEWNMDAADRHFQRALELDPNSADTLWMYAHLPSNLGRHDEALALISRARQLDPLSGLINAMEGQFLLHAGRVSEALERLKEALELNPKSRVAHLFASSAFIELGRFDEALSEARIANDLCPANSSARANEACAYARAGNLSEASAILNSLIELAARQHLHASNIALVYNALGRTIEAIERLERAAEQHDPWLVFLAADSKWKNLRDNPRFIALLRRVNLSPD